MNCDEKFVNVCRAINDGSPRFRADKRRRDIEQNLEELQRLCPPAYADYARLLAARIFGSSAIDEIIRDLVRMRSDSLPYLVRIAVLKQLAALTLRSTDVEANFGLRAEALELARASDDRAEIFIILVAWLFARLSLEQYDDAERMLVEIDAAESASSDVLSPEVDYARGRFAAHKARLLFWRATRAGLDLGSLEQGNRLYEQAVSLLRGNDHSRVNALTEWAEALHRIDERYNVSSNPTAWNVLERAERGLDTHACELCLAYFHQVRGLVFNMRANRAIARDLRNAQTLWTAALKDFNESEKHYSLKHHPFAKFPKAYASVVERRMIDVRRPRRVFLSHKGTDKPMVRDFKRTLELLRYEPWLDEDAMTAGVELERGLSDGFKESCGAVFFVTESFTDEHYLRTEVNYAIREKRRKGNDFAIITLVFSGQSGRTPEVPELLQTYVWKAPQSQLEALREIVRALPVSPAVPIFSES